MLSFDPLATKPFDKTAKLFILSVWLDNLVRGILLFESHIVRELKEVCVIYFPFDNIFIGN